MSTQHTPGPWVVYHHATLNNYQVIEKHAASNDGLRDTVAHGIDNLEDAQLIAAAPDMLKALQRAAALAWFTVATMPEGSLRDDAIYTHTLIRNALNKAGKGTQ